MSETVELYQNLKEELINSALFFLKGFDADQLAQVRTALDMTLYRYEVSKKETTLVVYDEGLNEMLLRRFLVTKQVQGCTKQTLKVYQDYLKRVLWTINKPVTEITSDDIRYYLANKELKKKVSKRSLDNELRVLRTFFNYLRDEEIITKTPTARLSKIKWEKTNKKAFSDVEIELLRNSCSDEREKFLIELLLSTGCRIGEVEKILLEDIQDDSLVVHGKGQKDRRVYLNAKAIVSLKNYLKIRGETDNKFLFNSDYKINIHKGRGLSIGALEDIVRGVGKRAGIENCHPHRFRRTCATQALRRGMPIEQVSKMLGHEEISTTQIYLDLTEEDLAAAHKKFVV